MLPLDPVLGLFRRSVRAHFVESGDAAGHDVFHRYGAGYGERLYAIAGHHVVHSRNRVRMRKVNRHHAVQPQFRQVLLCDEADLVQLVLAVDLNKYGFVEFASLSDECTEEIAERRIDQLHERDLVDGLVHHVGCSAKCIVRGEVTEYRNDADNDGEADTGIGQVKQAVEPPERFKEKVYCRYQRHDEQRTTKEVSKNSSYCFFHRYKN